MIDNISQRLALAIQGRLFKSPLYPYDRKTPKDKRTKPHMKDTTMGAFIRLSPTMVQFEYGNELAEELTPHYHILEDAKTIRNPGQGTQQSRGSQAGVRPKSSRDYSVGTYDSLGFQSQEYRGSFSYGKRSYVVNKETLKKRLKKNKTAGQPFRYNKHFAYIERILEKELPLIAPKVGLRMLTSSKGLLIPERMEKEPSVRDMISMFHTRGEE